MRTHHQELLSLSQMLKILRCSCIFWIASGLCHASEQSRAEQLKKKKSRTNTNEEGRVSALLSCKHHVFWQAVRKIADREARLEDIAAATAERDESSVLDFMLYCFPDETKRSDGRLWLPLYLASILEDIQTLFAANPAAIKTHTDERSKLNPCLLAAMMKNPRMEIIQRLQTYYPRFGSSLDKYSNTALHLATRYSGSASMVRALAELYLAVLKMQNGVSRMHSPPPGR